MKKLLKRLVVPALSLLGLSLVLPYTGISTGLIADAQAGDKYAVLTCHINGGNWAVRYADQSGTVTAPMPALNSSCAQALETYKAMDNLKIKEETINFEGDPLAGGSITIVLQD